MQPDNPEEVFDLAHVFAGGRATLVSDQHYGAGRNLILPGRGAFFYAFRVAHFDTIPAQVRTWAMVGRLSGADRKVTRTG